MKNKRRQSALCIGALFCFMTLQSECYGCSGSLNFNDGVFLRDAGKIGLIFGVAAISIYGLTKLGKWIFSIADEDVIKGAHDSCTHALVRFDTMATILDEAYRYAHSKESIIYDISESILYQLATAKFCADCKSPVHTLVMRLESSIDTLRYYHKEMARRMHALSTLDGMYHRMDVLMQKISYLLPRIELLRDYVYHHKSYFILYDHEVMLLERYGKEINSLHMYQDNLEYLKVAFHITIMEKNNTIDYPYLDYIYAFNVDLNKLYRYIENVTYDYHNRIGVARDLCRRLEIVKNYIINSEYYHNELHDHEYAKIEKEKKSAEGEVKNRLCCQYYCNTDESYIRRKAIQKQQRCRLLFESLYK